MADSTVQFLFSSWFGIKSAVQNVESTQNWRSVSPVWARKPSDTWIFRLRFSNLCFFITKKPYQKADIFYISRRSSYICIYIYVFYITYTWINFCFLTTNPPWKKYLLRSKSVFGGQMLHFCLAFRIPPWYLGIYWDGYRDTSGRVSSFQWFWKFHVLYVKLYENV